MYRRFPSLAHPEKYAYTYDSQAWDSRAPLDSKFRMYETYGDGLTAHSPDWAVTTEYLTDYLVSLASFAASDDEFLADLYFTLHRGPAERDIKFAASVIHKPVPEEKKYDPRSTRYFSTEERKVSASPNKRHDKRYFEITEEMNGSAKSIVSVLMWSKKDWIGSWEAFQVVTAVYDWIQNQDGMWMELPGVYLNWFKTDRANESEKSRLLRDAYAAMRNLTEAHRLRECASSTVASYKRQMERKREKESQPEPAPPPDPDFAPHSA